uniref:Transferred entry: 3.1.21.10 n=1 Tax=Steinernema glaseri TaxID=37863 RepID=A0A1I7YNE2_9BILA
MCRRPQCGALRGRRGYARHSSPRLPTAKTVSAERPPLVPSVLLLGFAREHSSCLIGDGTKDAMVSAAAACHLCNEFGQLGPFPRSKNRVPAALPPKMPGAWPRYDASERS